MDIFGSKKYRGWYTVSAPMSSSAGNLPAARHRRTLTQLGE